MAKLLIVVFTAWLAAGAVPDAGAQTGETLVFVLAGQSNMVGQGDVAKLSEDLKQLPPNILLYLNGERADFADRNHFGPEIGFAHEMSRAHPREAIILIKFAVGGSSLLAWAPEWSPALRRTGIRLPRKSGTPSELPSDSSLAPRWSQRRASPSTMTSCTTIPLGSSSSGVASLERISSCEEDRGPRFQSSVRVLAGSGRA